MLGVIPNNNYTVIIFILTISQKKLWDDKNKFIKVDRNNIFDLESL